MVITALLLAASLFTPRLQEGETLPSVLLSDQTGSTFQLGATGRGTTILTFFYTHCPDINLCPNITGKFAWIAAHVSPREQIQLVEISLDPKRDTTATLALYARQFTINANRWHVVRASPNLTEELLTRFAVTSSKDLRGNILHTDMVAVVDTRAHLIERVEGSLWNPQDILDIAHAPQDTITAQPHRLWAWLASRASEICGNARAYSPTIGGALLIFVLTAGVIFKTCSNWTRS